jgi:hypothetical protein
MQTFELNFSFLLSAGMVSIEYEYSHAAGCQLQTDKKIWIQHNSTTLKETTIFWKME